MRPKIQSSTANSSIPSFHLLVGGGLVDGTPEETSPPGGDKTSLLTGGCVSGHGGSVTDMLMITTTVGIWLLVDVVIGKHRDIRSTGFIATPRVRGHEFLLAFMAWCFRPAFKKGLSTRPLYQVSNWSIPIVKR